MSEITDRVVKGSKRFAKKATARSKKLAKQLSDGTQQFLNGTVKSSEKIAKDFSKKSQNIYKQFEKGNITEGIKGTGNLISDSFGQVVASQYLNIILKLLIALYTAFLIPNLSKGFAYFFDNLLVKILFALLIVFLSSKDPSLAILIALSYILTLQQSNKYRLIEKSQQVEPTFNNEYFNYENESTLDSSDKQLSIPGGFMQNDFNEKSDSLNQNYQRVDNCNAVTNGEFKHEEESTIDSSDDKLYFPHKTKETNVHHSLSEENHQENVTDNIVNPSIIQNNKVTYETVPSEVLGNNIELQGETLHSEILGGEGVHSEVELPQPIPVESSGENNYHLYDNNLSNKTINTPESESLDFSSRQFDNCTVNNEKQNLGSISTIQGYQKDGPSPYSAGDLSYSNI